MSTKVALYDLKLVESNVVFVWWRPFVEDWFHENGISIPPVKVFRKGLMAYYVAAFENETNAVAFRLRWSDDLENNR